VKSEIGIGLLGLGVVGSGVVEVLISKADKLAKHVGASLVLKRVLMRDVSKGRAVNLGSHLLTSNVAEVLTDPEIDIVIEVIGREHPATEYIEQAITNEKHVVTANKEVMAKHGYGLLSLAQKYNVGLRYEASVGSGIPLIATFQQDLASNEIWAIHGILNGTTNYILTQMAQQGLDFPSALGQAQELGYAEPDPANDVEGIDAAYKLAILSSLAFHSEFDAQGISCQGIAGLAAQDFRYAREFGYAIKLLAIAKRQADTVEMRVHPVFLPENSQLAKVDGVYNAIQVEGDLAGRLIFYGEGAGALRASSAIIADVLTISRNICRGLSNVLDVQLNQKLEIKPMSDIETRYYFRLSVNDRPGVLAQISKALGDNSVSISSVIQKESDPLAHTAELVIMTHSAREEAVQKALGEVKQLAVVNEVSSFVRVEG
jgi:homoserine dehydrogenase